MLPSEPDSWATWDRAASQYIVVGTMFTGNPTSLTSSSSATTSETSSRATASSDPDTTTSETSSPTESAQGASGSSEPHTELSTGAKAGIGAGVGVGAILTAAVVYLLWKMRKNEKAAKESKQLPYAHNGPPPMESAWQQPYYAPTEPQKPQELHGHQYQGYGVRAELPTTRE